MGDRRRAGKQHQYFTKPPTPAQPPTFNSAGRDMCTGQSAVMLYNWGVKAGMVHSTCG